MSDLDETRCFAIFTTDSGSSITLVFELYAEKYPKTVANFLSLCTGSNDLKLSYRDSRITRILSPEFIIQGGLISRKSHDAVACDLKAVVDNEEYIRMKEEGIDQDKLPQGTLCLIDDNDTPEVPTQSKCEFFIPLRNLSKYPNLTNKYLIIGKLIDTKNTVTRLIDWGNEIEVNDDGMPLVPTFISRVGQLIKKVGEKDKGKAGGNEDNNNNEEDQVDLFDAVFGKSQTKSKSSKRSSHKRVKV